MYHSVLFFENIEFQRILVSLIKYHFIQDLTFEMWHINLQTAGMVPFGIPFWSIHIYGPLKNFYREIIPSIDSWERCYK